MVNNDEWADELIDSIDADWWHDGQVHYEAGLEAKKQTKLAILSKLESIEQEARIIKAGEVIPYKTIKGTDYVELNWLTRKFKGKG